MTFRTVPSSPDDRLRVVVVGAGAMGRAWLSAVEDSAEVELVGVADLDQAVARQAVVGLGRPDVTVGSDPLALAADAGAQALINVTVPAAHHPVATAALFAGLPVLGEKPVADTVARALSLAAAAEVAGELFMVSQSRRWNPQLFALRGMVQDLGAIGLVTTQFFRATRFGGFREQMAHPLLVDMAIHPFDAVRFLLAADPVSVYCESFNPAWSWYAGDAAASAVFEMAGGTRFVYTGSWCSPGPETSWNGSWRVSGAHGSALWDGDTEPVLEGAGARSAGLDAPHAGIRGSLAAFVAALRTGVAPMGEVHENVLSLAMVEAAVQSSAAGAPVRIDDVLDTAHEMALRDEDRPDVRAALVAWPSVRGALRS
jgi:predicted dehydrogenase